MKYQLLGKLPPDTVNFFLEEILKRKVPNMAYQWIQFDNYLHNEFLKIFSNTELKIQQSEDATRPIQKAFYSAPGHGFRIHKDGTRCRSALNIAISCNDDDWVRWYDEDYINSISTLNTILPGTSKLSKFGSSRNTDIFEYENIPYTEELRNQVGDVYVLDVDAYHSFKCNGNKPRIIIQTKFHGFPNLETIATSLKQSSFTNIMPNSR